MTVPLSSLLSRVVPDTHDRVERARQRWNQPIREALRHETGLRLNRQEADGTQRPLFEAIAVPVKLEAGLPVALQKVELKPDEALKFMLGRWRGTLAALDTSAGQVQRLVQELEADGHLADVIRGQTTHLQAAKRLAVALLDASGESDPITKILSVDDDVLGVYRYELPKNPPLFGPDLPQRVRIELYWGVIGLVAELLNRSVEALTVVVLTHELAHAYSHLGTDIDGHRWTSRAFGQTERPVKEGLAQYYTEIVCKRLRGDFPEAFDAFEDLLAHQPPAYKSYRLWIANAQPEEIRSAMIETRRTGAGTEADLKQRLSDIRTRLRVQA
jgi:hypothetical protein